MKSKLTLLILLLVFTLNFNLAFAAEDLPEIPWRTIVETQNDSLKRSIWKDTIKVKLFGNYSEMDSLMVVNSIALLDSITERIRIMMTANARGNLEIYFLDSTNMKYYQKIVRINSKDWNSGQLTSNEQNIQLFSLAINSPLISKEKKQNHLTNCIAFSLYPTFWRNDLYYFFKKYEDDRYKSIFQQIDKKVRDQLLLEELHEFDKKLLSEVYSIGFFDKLRIAKNQFRPIIPSWLKINPHSFLLLPLLLIVLIIVVLYFKISKNNIQRITNKFVRFNVNGLLLGPFIAIIITFYLSLSSDVLYKLFTFNQLIDRLIKLVIPGAIYILGIGLSLINILRFLEITIQKNTEKMLFRIVLIFISTILIPFTAFLVFRYFVFDKNINENEIRNLSYLLLICIAVACIRSLISYFIFKEKDLISKTKTSYRIFVS